MLRTLLHTSLFLAGFGATAAWLVSVDRLPFWSYTRPQAHTLSVAIDEVDTIFLGSSRVMRGVSPALFDARMTALGRPSLSYNFGVAGTRAHDYERQIEWILEQRPKKLRRIVLEASTYRQPIRDGQWMKDLSVETHEAVSLPSRLSSILAEDADLDDKLEVTGYVLAHTLVNALRVGQGPRILDDWCRRWSGRLPSRFFAHANRGYAPLSAENPPSKIRGEQHRAWIANPQLAENLLWHKRNRGLPEEYRGGFDHWSCERQIARLEEAGIELVYVVMPSHTIHFYGRDGLDEHADEVVVLDFEDPDEFPTLYQFENWFDETHLGAAGAMRFSTLLADAVAALPPPASEREAQ
ncbi:MAG: hypothetical protein ACON4Z_10160 [Planctomycetota bacterium]